MLFPNPELFTQQLPTILKHGGEIEPSNARISERFSILWNLQAMRHPICYVPNRERSFDTTPMDIKLPV
jgi:hypothetical protein